MSELAYDINNNRVVSGKYTMPTIAAVAASPFLGNVYGNAAINSAFAAHGLNHAVNEGVNGIGDAVLTGLEMAPLGPLVKPLYTGLVKPLYTGVVRPGMQFLNSPITRKAPQITAENAASITPEQWTAAQDAAIARGGMAEAQRLRDLHFKVSAPNTKVVDINGNPQLVIHKTPSDFTVFDNSKSIGRLNWAATPEAFGENKVFATGAGTNPKEMRLYINMKNPHYPTIDEGMEPAYINEGEDGILGIVDKDWTGLYKSASDAGEGFNMSLGVDNPYALKSADVVTYDDNGIRIPLGERDNFNINDIRYGLLPFGIGLTGLGVSTGTPLKKFEDGKNALLSSIPKLSNIPKLNFDAPEYEEIKPKEEIPIEPIKPIERVRTFNKDEDHPILTEIQSYVNSPVFVNRLKRMTSSNGAAEQITGIARENVNNTELKNWPTERNAGASYNKSPIYTPVYLRHKNMPIYPKIRWGRSPYNNQSFLYQNLSDPAIDSISYVGNNFTPQGISHERNVLAHEIAHSVYEDFENYNEYRNFTPEYRKVLDRGIQKDSFNSNHDNKWIEKIADIWSLQQFAKDNNIWDKSSDTEFTKEMYDKLKSKMYETFPRGKESDYHPNTRSFDMWNDEDLRWLINTTAQIKPVKNNIYYT